MSEFLTESSRGNPNQMAYFQSVADLIAIYGLFHQQLVRDDKKPFTSPFDLKSIIQKDYPHQIPPLSRYADCAALSTGEAWDEFQSMLEYGATRKRSKGYGMYTNHYVMSLAREANVLSTNGSLINSSKFNIGVGSIIRTALDNAARISVQLCAIFGDKFDSNYPILMSRVNLIDLDKAKEMIGIGRAKGGKDYNYDLLDLKEGLNRETLRRLGRGRAIGCPASLPISDETAAFLAKYNISVGKETMLKRYIRAFKDDFDTQVMKPFSLMSAEEKDRCLPNETVRLLSGEVLAEVGYMDAIMPGGFDLDR